MAKNHADVGKEMGDLLLAWRPKMSPEDVADALMSALEFYSMGLEGPSEVGLRSGLYRLTDRIEARHRSI